MLQNKKIKSCTTFMHLFTKHNYHLTDNFKSSYGRITRYEYFGRLACNAMQYNAMKAMSTFSL